MEKRLHGNNTKLIRTVLKESKMQHPTKQHLFSHSKTIPVRRKRHAGHYWNRKDELISDVLSWNSTHGPISVGRPARIDLHQLCGDAGCRQENMPVATETEMDGARAREGKRERCYQHDLMIMMMMNCWNQSFVSLNGNHSPIPLYTKNCYFGMYFRFWFA